MHWVLQENLFQERERAQIRAAVERWGLPYSLHKVVPFSGDLIPPPQPLAPKVICLGSYSMRHTARRKGWTPGVYDLEGCSFVEQHRRWGDRMLNADSRVVPFSDAAIERATFVRPVEDTKVFAGRVFEPDELGAWREKVAALGKAPDSSLDGDTLVQLSEPKELYVEIRYWIVGGRIAGRSQYRRGGRVVYSPDVDDRYDRFVEEVIDDRPGAGGWQPRRAFVLDVAETADGLRIVEINTLNSAGFYAADIQRIVLALEELEGG